MDIDEMICDLKLTFETVHNQRARLTLAPRFREANLFKQLFIYSDHFFAAVI